MEQPWEKSEWFILWQKLANNEVIDIQIKDPELDKNLEKPVISCNISK